MGLRADKKINLSIVENEIKHIRNKDAIVKLSISHIDEKVADIGFLEDDLDYAIFKETTIEFSFLDLRVWIDVVVKNDSYDIECIDVKDINDEDYRYLATMLHQDIEAYCHRSSIQRAYSYNQALEIQYDQNDPYNLRPKMALGYGVNPKYLQDLKSICDEDESRIILFIKHGYAGSRLTMKRKAKPIHAVKTILPMVISNTFDQVSSLSGRQEIARFIYDNFESYNGDASNRRTIENNISKNYFAC